jgi:uncharacterized protein (UPF0333 family)
MSDVQAQEKDMFWVYIAGLVIAVIVTLFMVKGSEHDKYATSAKAIAEDASNSAYKHKP